VQCGKIEKSTVKFFLTRGNVGNKVCFGGTGDLFGGAGRSPLLRKRNLVPARSNSWRDKTLLTENCSVQKRGRESKRTKWNNNKPYSIVATAKFC